MTIFVPVANAAQFSCQYSQSDGSFAENEWWVQRSAAWTLAELETMAAAFVTWWETGTGTVSFKNQMCSLSALVGVGFRDMTTQNGFTGIYQTGLPVSATGLATDVPLGLSISVTARTGKAGRSFRGRTFVACPQKLLFSNLETNALDPAQAPNLVQALASLITAVPAADATCTLVVCSRYYQPGGPRTPTVPRAAGVTTPITSYGLHDLYEDFQRRRAPGHNRHH